MTLLVSHTTTLPAQVKDAPTILSEHTSDLVPMTLRYPAYPFDSRGSPATVGESGTALTEARVPPLPRGAFGLDAAATTLQRRPKRWISTTAKGWSGAAAISCRRVGAQERGGVIASTTTPGPRYHRRYQRDHLMRPALLGPGTNAGGNPLHHPLPPLITCAHVAPKCGLTGERPGGAHGALAGCP